MIDPGDHPCICGHYEGSHRRALPGCKVKNCKCRGFLNRHYLDWLRYTIAMDVETLFKLQREYESYLRSKAKARRAT